MVNFNMFNINLLQQLARQSPAARDAAGACLAGYFVHVAIHLNGDFMRNPDLAKYSILFDDHDAYYHHSASMS